MSGGVSWGAWVAAHTATVIWMTATMVGDMVITGCILWGLVRSRTAIQQTRQVRWSA